MLQRINPMRQFAILFIAVALLVFLMQCSRPKFIPDDYEIVTARALSIVKYTREHPEGREIYRLMDADANMITAVTYDPDRNLIAIAEQNKEPQRGTAVIKIFDEKTFSIVDEIVTEKDRIFGMSIDRKGRIAFTTGDITIDTTGELCYVSLNDKVVHSVAKGSYFFSPAWGKDSQRIYFGFSSTAKQSPSDRIGYIEVAAPYDIKQVAEGRSVDVSESGKVAYLANNGAIILLHETGDVSMVAKQIIRHLDPQFADGIRFVRGTDDIVIKHWKVPQLFSDLIALQSPYKKEKLMLPYMGMQDYDVAFSRKAQGK